MLERAKERFGLQPASVTADKSYGTGEFLSWLSNRQMTPYIPVLDRKQQTKGFYTQNDFIRLPEENAYRLSGGPGASLHRVESRFTGLYVQCKAVALPRLFTQAGVHAVLNSPYAESELV